MSFAGDIHTFDVFDLLGWLMGRKRAGVLQMTQRSTKKRVAFRDGRVQWSSSNDPRETIGQALVRDGLIQEEQLFRALLKQEAPEEKRRLGDPDMPLWDQRMLRNRILHGLVLEWSFALAIFWSFGFAAFAAFVLQAYSAVRLLEAVNYFEHWGLERTGRRVRTIDSWDTDSWFTLYTLVGLSRHSDHHARASRAYQMLRRFDESPKMPSGYYGTILMALLQNERYRELVTHELERKRLGPFRNVTTADQPSAATPTSEQALLAAGT